MLTVTDHALLRLIERGHGVDVEMMRRDLEARLKRASNAAEKLGGQFHVVLDGLRYVVRDGMVITVLAPDATHAARKNGISRARDRERDQ